MKYSIIIVFLFILSGCSKQKYSFYDLPDKCFKSVAIINNIDSISIGIGKYESYIFSQSADNYFERYSKISFDQEDDMTITCPYGEYQFYCIARCIIDSKNYKAFYYKWRFKSGKKDIFNDTATIVTNLDEYYFRKLFPNHKGKIIKEDKDSIFIDGSSMPKDLYRPIKIK